MCSRVSTSAVINLTPVKDDLGSGLPVLVPEPSSTKFNLVTVTSRCKVLVP